MEFFIDELRVFWPYVYVYPEQYSYMVHLKRLLDKTGASNSGLLEMPCGTGKTMSVMALVVSYQLAYPAFGKLFFLSRTVPEMEAALGELRRLHGHLLRATAGQAALHERVQEFLGVGLSSRSQLCVNELVNGQGGGERVDVDGACRALQPEWGGEGCRFRESGEKPPPVGVFTMEEMRALAVKEGFCSYYASRELMSKARVIVFSYQYVLHGKILDEITKPHIAPRSIAVFDEAHNMDQVCIESLTVRIGRPTLEDSRVLCEQLEARVQQQNEAIQARLREEYDALVAGLRGRGVVPRQGEPDEGALDPVLEEQPVPGALRKAAPFLRLLARLADYLLLQLGEPTTKVELPATFLRRVARDLALPDTRALQFVAARLKSLLRVLQVAWGREVAALRTLAELVSLLAMHAASSAFSVIRYAPNAVPRAQQRLGWDDGMLQLACLDASLAMTAPKALFGTVLITSATLSPLAMFPKLLSLRPALLEVMASANVRRCVLPLIVCKGTDQALLNTKFLSRNEPNTHRNYAALLQELAAVVPDGMIAFFPSYGFLETCVAAWHAAGSLQALLRHKLVFLETRDARETAIALASFKRACDAGRGALLLCVARGKVSEGVDFSHHHGRCVVVIGLPYQYTKGENRFLFFFSLLISRFLSLQLPLCCSGWTLCGATTALLLGTI